MGPPLQQGVARHLPGAKSNIGALIETSFPGNNMGQAWKRTSSRGMCDLYFWTLYESSMKSGLSWDLLVWMAQEGEKCISGNKTGPADEA